MTRPAVARCVGWATGLPLLVDADEPPRRVGVASSHRCSGRTEIRRYERTEEPVSHRNGYEPRKLRTTSGTVCLERPRVRDAQKLGFESRVLGRHVTRTFRSSRS